MHILRLIAFCVLLALTACSNTDTSATNTGSTISELSRDKIFYSIIGTTSSGGGTLRELYVINADNTGKKQLTFTDDGWLKEFVGLSSDGFAVYKNRKDYSLYSVPLSNPSLATTKKIASDPTMDITPLTITSDNRVIYYVGWDLFSVKVDGSEAPKALNPTSNSSAYVGLTSNNLVIYGDNNGLHAIDPGMIRQPITLSASASSTDAQLHGTTVVFYSADTPGFYKFDTSVPAPQRVLLLAVDQYYSLAKVQAGYVIYTKFTLDGYRKLWKINLDGTGSTQLTTSSSNDDDFIALTSTNKLIYKKQDAFRSVIYSVDITGGVETPVTGDPLRSVMYSGLTNDNRVILTQYGVDPLYASILSVKGDGTGLITLADGTSGVTAGGRIQLVTPDGWVVYEKGSNSSTMTSVKADNSIRGTFENFQGTMGITSTNRIVAHMLDGNKSRLYTVKGDGTEKLLLDTEFVDSILLITP